MTLEEFISTVDLQCENTSFDELMSLIDSFYHFIPTSFANGTVQNEAGQNNGSCKLFYFAKLNKLTDSQILKCFGQYYRDVLNHPDGDGHQNIREFMKTGLSGVRFDGVALLDKL